MRIRNATSLTLTSVHLATGPEDQITEESIGPSQTTAERAVHAVYETVAVDALVNGKIAALIPVEGFAGFNPPRQPGRYIVTIALRAESTPAQPQIDATIAKVNP